MSDTAMPSTNKTLERIVVPEIVDMDAITTTLGPSIDQALARASKIAASIVDDMSREVAIDAVEKVQESVDILEQWRQKEYHEKYYEPGEEVRSQFDPRIKTGKAVKKLILASVSEYNYLMERKAKLAREAAAAEARRIQEAADLAQKEAEAAEARAKQAAVDEANRKKEAEAAEARRIQSEKDAEERRQREAREAAVAETKRKQDEETAARLAHAEKAEEVGNGDTKVTAILDSVTPISPVVAAPQQATDLEALRIEKKLADDAAAEKALRDKAASEEAEKKRLAAEDDARVKREAANQAAAAAAAAQAAASGAIVISKDARTTSVTRWNWDLDSDGTLEGDKKAFLAVLRAFITSQDTENPVPFEFVGFNPKKATDFRPALIGEKVTELKEKFSFPGIKAYPVTSEQMARRKVGGAK